MMERELWVHSRRVTENPARSDARDVRHGGLPVEDVWLLPHRPTHLLRDRVGAGGAAIMFIAARRRALRVIGDSDQLAPRLVQVQTLVIANPTDESVVAPRRPARLTVVQVRSNQQVGANKGSVVEHEQANRGGPVRRWWRPGKLHRMELIRMAARDPNGIQGRGATGPAARLELLRTLADSFGGELRLRRSERSQRNRLIRRACRWCGRRLACRAHQSASQHQSRDCVQITRSHTPSYEEARRVLFHESRFAPLVSAGASKHRRLHLLQAETAWKK